MLKTNQETPMTFEIWQVADDGMAALVEALDDEGRETFEDFGCVRLRELEAASIEKAQDMFAAWCRESCPAAREEPATTRQIQMELAKALAQ